MGSASIKDLSLTLEFTCLWHFLGTREAKTGEFPGVHRPVKLAYLVSSRPVSKNKAGLGRWLRR